MSKIFIFKGENDSNKTQSEPTFDIVQCFSLSTSENEKVSTTELISGWTTFFGSKSFNFIFRTEAKQSNMQSRVNESS